MGDINNVSGIDLPLLPRVLYLDLGTVLMVWQLVLGFFFHVINNPGITIDNMSSEAMLKANMKISS